VGLATHSSLSLGGGEGWGEGRTLDTVASGDVGVDGREYAALPRAAPLLDPLPPPGEREEVVASAAHSPSDGESNRRRTIPLPMTFEDHYSGHADAYARHRPRYPDALYDWVASLTPERALAWDAGTGNGQVAVALADHFKRVIATDASAGQLAMAVQHDRVEYRLEPSDKVTLADGSVDLITAAAAVHWFELDGFYSEVRRVARPGTMIALWSYGPRDIADAVGPLVHRYQEEIVGPYWPERIGYVHDRYASLPFPFAEHTAPEFQLTATWNLDELLAFLDTWSASQRYLREHGRQASEAIRKDLEREWGDPLVRRDITWPLFFRVGRV
jgi:ubiquinone/menaquinone biosynthesis C-methylase UbiE